MQQSYRRTPMPKSYFNKVAKQLVQSTLRRIKEDQISELLVRKKVTSRHQKKNLLKTEREYLVYFSCFVTEDTIYVKPRQYLNGVSLFLVKVSNDLNFEMHPCGIKFTVSTLSRIEYFMLNQLLKSLSDTKNMRIDNKECVF